MAARFQSASSRLPLVRKSFATLITHSQGTKAQRPPAGINLTGKTAVVTGSDSGIGYACADILLTSGLNHLIIVVRSQNKGDTAAVCLKKKHHNLGAAIGVFLLDLASYDSVQAFAKRYKYLVRMDIVIRNVGCADETFQILEPMGHERIIQVNFLSTALLAIMFLPLLKPNLPSDTPGRMTIASSGMSMLAKFPQHKASKILPAFDIEKDFDSMEQNCTAKFLIHLSVDKLAKYVKASDVVVNCVDPGLTKGTQLHQGMKPALGLMVGTLKLLTGRTAEEGASTYVDAVAVKDDGSHGSFLMDWRVSPFIEFYYKLECKEAHERHWLELIEEFKFAKAEEIVSYMAE